jgi:Methyltransferase domain
MQLAEVVNAFTRLIPNPRYLEIGLWEAGTFRAVNAAEKWGVDPCFRFNPGGVANPKVHLYEMTSDVFFETQNVPGIDVAFIDGLHTFNQALRDLLNILCVVPRHGVIILDDVMPTTYVESIGDPGLLNRVRTKTGDPSQSWAGDVYKIVFFIEAYLPLLSFHMVAETHGQLVCWRTKLARNVGRAFAQKLSDISGAEFGNAVAESDRYRTLPLEAISAKYVEERKLQIL